MKIPDGYLFCNSLVPSVQLEARTRNALIDYAIAASAYSFELDMPRDDEDELFYSCAHTKGSPWCVGLTDKLLRSATARNWASIYHSFLGRYGKTGTTPFHDYVHDRVINAYVCYTLDTFFEYGDEDDAVDIIPLLYEAANVEGEWDIGDVAGYAESITETLTHDSDWAMPLFAPDSPVEINPVPVEFYINVSCDPYEAYNEARAKITPEPEAVEQSLRVARLIAKQKNGFTEEPERESVKVQAQDDLRQRGGFVYAIKSSAAIKLGLTTTKPEARLACLQTSHHEKLTLLKAVKVPDALNAERSLHDQFKDRRLSGEWFRISDSEAIRALEQIA